MAVNALLKKSPWADGLCFQDSRVLIGVPNKKGRPIKAMILMSIRVSLIGRSRR